MRAVDSDGYFEEFGRKPRGLWFSVNDAWENYVLARSEWSRETLRFRTEVVFASSARIYQLRGPEQLVSLTEEYLTVRICTQTQESVPERPPLKFDWPRFSRDYDAIINLMGGIEQEVPAGWSTNWSVPSGCTWNPEVVTLRPINYSHHEQS